MAYIDTKCLFEHSEKEDVKSAEQNIDCELIEHASMLGLPQATGITFEMAHAISFALPESRDEMTYKEVLDVEDDDRDATYISFLLLPQLYLAANESQEEITDEYDLDLENGGCSITPFKSYIGPLVEKIIKSLDFALEFAALIEQEPGIELAAEDELALDVENENDYVATID